MNLPQCKCITQCSRMVIIVCAYQGLDDFGGDIVDPEGTAQDSMLDPEGNLEQPSSQNVAGLQLDASASTQQGEAKASLPKTWCTSSV